MVENKHGLMLEAKDSNDNLVGVYVDVIKLPIKQSFDIALFGDNPDHVNIYIDENKYRTVYIDDDFNTIKAGDYIRISLTTDNYENNIYEKALQKYGKQAQVMMFMEESAELTKELSKYIRSISSGGISDLDNELNILSEMADVYIIMEQLKYMFDFTDEMISEEIDKKLEKLKSYLADGD